MTAVVFDIGNVLLEWDPHAAFRADFPDEEAITAMMEEIGFFAWNLENDRGRGRADAVAAVARHWPHRKAVAEGYFERFYLTIRNRIEETWTLLGALQKRGQRTFALTNFAAETWPVALALHPRLGDAFEDVVVSGQVGLVKPQREIFDLLCARNGLGPDDCLLIDDSAANVEGARAAGWAAHHFTTPGRLHRDLADRGLL